jgi:hypothetical protein
MRRILWFLLPGALSLSACLLVSSVEAGDPDVAGADGTGDTQPGCATDLDCPALAGDWQACASTAGCGIAGLQTRSVTERQCQAGACVEGEVTTESQVCEAP